MGTVYRWVILALIFLSTPQVAVAEQRLALVIGNGKYAVGPLDNPSRDAELMAKVLSGSGFQVTHLSDLTYREFQRAVVQFGRNLQAAGNDTVGMFYYAGHAVQANGDNYLIPVDADISDQLDLEIQTLQVATLMRSLDAAGNRLNLVVLDACRNNPFKSISRSAGRGLAKVDAPFGTLLAYSTSPGDVAEDGSGRNSPYTAALARGIQNPGLAVEQVFKQVRIEVMEKTGNRQVPWESSSLTGDFFFSPPAPAVTEALPVDDSRDEEVAYWTSIATSTDPAMFESYLSIYPDGTFAGIATERVRQLTEERSAAAQRQAEQERHAQAAQVWEAVKDSKDPALVQTVIDRFPDTIYAQLAQVTLQSLSNRAAVAMAPANENSERERLFWDSIKNSTNPSDYKAYLDQFPDGTFAAIARNRVEVGNQPRVAALGGAATSHPYDGQWSITWKVIGGYSSSARWCSAGENGTKVIDVVDGTFKGSMRSNYSGTAYIDLKIDEGGGVRFHARVPGWSVGTIANSFKIEGGQFEDILKETGYCRAELAMRRQ
ncbi:caspase family protein [Pacificispira sp.]|uniref:caspase family protein n=1 Tax=Pacificispira sp. TaxID=2888761 RepID=UPI003B517233